MIDYENSGGKVSRHEFVIIKILQCFDNFQQKNDIKTCSFDRNNTGLSL